jgi:NDP-sugar pyrophosphorylase family protein
MKALILAAGMGTRLKPLTDTTPKALVPVGGKPMLEHLILKLKKSGFCEIVVNIHHLGEQIVSFLEANNRFGLTIHISDERACLMDTGGAIKQAAVFLEDNEPFLVHNVDIVSDVDLGAFRSGHQRDSLATLLVSRRASSRLLLFDQENALCGWRNRSTGEVKFCSPAPAPLRYNEYAFGGVHILSPEVFARMAGWSGSFSIISFYLSARPGEVRAYPSPGLALIDAGNLESLSKAEKFLKQE